MKRIIVLVVSLAVLLSVGTATAHAWFSVWNTTGWVRNQYSGRGVKGVTITATKGTEVGQGYTGYSGYYQIKRTSGGVWTYTASKPGCTFSSPPPTSGSHVSFTTKDCK